MDPTDKSVMRTAEEHTGPVTNRLSFVCVDSDGDFDDTGVAAVSGQTFDRLSQAKADCGGRIYVVDHFLGASVDRDARLSRQAFLNAEPYLEPVEVVAGGGFVTRVRKERRDLLLIFRRGRWDLPKGKLDEHETVRECALREVREEVGVWDLKIRKTLGETVHGYADGSRYAVKTTYWYEMSTAGGSFHPQEKEGIEAVEWVEWKAARTLLGYETLREHMDAVEHLLTT